VCADLAFGLRARIEGCSTRPKEKKKRKEKKRKTVLASHHHRKNFVFCRAGRAIGSKAFLSKEEINLALLELADSVSRQTPLVEILCWPTEKASGLKYRIYSSINKIYISTKLQVTICNYLPGTGP
jgi:hypothetical protein